VLDDDTVETLAARILVQEHEAYVEALQKLARNFIPSEARDLR
jgi:folate-dependent phosphoribosylglycinamide formyltransferase PurN